MTRHTQSVHRVGIACFGGKTIPRHLFFVLLPDFSLWLFFGIFQIPKLCRLLPKRDICVCKLRIGKGDNRLNTSAVGGTAKILSCQFFIVKAAVFVKINRCRAQQSVNLPRFNGSVKPLDSTVLIVFLFAKLCHLPKGVSVAFVDLLEQYFTDRAEVKAVGKPRFCLFISEPCRLFAHFLGFGGLHLAYTAVV